MNDTRDDGPEMRPGREAAIRHLVLEHLEGSRERRARRRRRRWVAWGGVGVLAVGLGATAAGIALQPQSVSNDQVIHCLTSDTRAADGSYPGAMASMAHDDDAERAANAIEVCTMTWQQGALEPGFDPTSSTNAPGVVPEAFILCAMPDGSAAVVPSSEPAICSRLGLAPLDTGDSPMAPVWRTTTDRATGDAGVGAAAQTVGRGLLRVQPASRPHG
ncbi:hypothetical protein [Agromyces lapidis]|uniref:DUF3515 family protein n=1 Tax=Agromyces lapidis TaxID=279574 RepID=A0ABV5SUH5_9MICO|nr:hypothetical protein [Agromyces lapidis]